MIEHLGIPVSDLPRSLAFYRAALAPLGYEVVREVPVAVGLGIKGKPEFWIASGHGGGATVHVAFHAATRKLVDAFYQAAIAAGGKDNGAPGVRAHYHPSYYGAFVLDPDGNNIEAVCHERYL